jgi:cytochrome c-type biogenesis protein CcmH
VRAARHAVPLALALVAAWPLHAQSPAEEAAFELPQARPEQVVGAPKGRPLAGTALDQRTNEVSALLRCPVCQGLSVADSRAGTAVAMKAQVRDMLAAGYDQQQVLNYFERSYGGFVRLEPEWRSYWLVWLAPVLGLLLGGFVVLRALRAPKAATAPAAPEAAAAGEQAPDDEALPRPDTLPDDAELAVYVRRVRELAYGWPGGEPPRAS